MNLTKEQAGAVSGGVFLIGMGALFFTGAWWPGIMIVLGVTGMVEGFLEGEGWYGLQGGLWLLAIGIWAFFHYNLAILFVGLGLSSILSAFIRPPFLATAKPYVDNTLE